MLSQTMRIWIALGLIGVLAQAAGALGQDETPPPAPQQAIPARVVLQVAVAQKVRALVQEEAPPQGEYWIGIALGELPAVARQQLKLEHGLVVDDVLPDSPAAKAEFKQFDVLVKAGDQPLNEPADILKAVDEAKDKELAIELVRGGERLKLLVVPQKRPQADMLLPKSEEGAAGELRLSSIKKIEEALRELKGKGDHEAIELYFARPGIVSTKVKEIELPQNLSISVTKDGESPAKVHVKRDGKEWNVTADKISELPEDVRRHVEQLLGKVMHPMLSARARSLVVGDRNTRMSSRSPTVTPPAVALPKSLDPQPVPAIRYRVRELEDGVDAKLSLIIKKLDTLESKALEQLQDEVKRLRKELDELRK